MQFASIAGGLGYGGFKVDMDSVMEYLVDPDPEEMFSDLEIDPGLLLRKDHLPWLLALINTVPEQNIPYTMKSESLFCVTCSRYLTYGEDSYNHRHYPSPGANNVFPFIRVLSVEPGQGRSRNFYVSVMALRDMQVPIGDVLSHVLPHHRADGVSIGTSRCLYLHPQDTKEETWHGDAFSGRCAYRGCEKMFNNKHSHLKVYGITPQFCSITCKLTTWLCCNIAGDTQAESSASRPQPPQPPPPSPRPGTTNPPNL